MSPPAGPLGISDTGQHKYQSAHRKIEGVEFGGAALLVARGDVLARDVTSVVIRSLPLTVT